MRSYQSPSFLAKLSRVLEYIVLLPWELDLINHRSRIIKIQHIRFLHLFCCVFMCWLQPADLESLLRMCRVLGLVTLDMSSSIIETTLHNLLRAVTLASLCLSKLWLLQLYAVYKGICATKGIKESHPLIGWEPCWAICATNQPAQKIGVIFMRSETWWYTYICCEAIRIYDLLM